MATILVRSDFIVTAADDSKKAVKVAQALTDVFSKLENVNGRALTDSMNAFLDFEHNGLSSKGDAQELLVQIAAYIRNAAIIKDNHSAMLSAHKQLAALVSSMR